MEKKNEINILLLGASGAGKSSFAKTFLLHSDYIDSTNDGQTTRSNIIYDLSLYNENPMVKVKFQGKDEFLRKMIRINYERYLLTILNIIDSEKKIRTLKEYLLNRKDNKNNTKQEIVNKFLLEDIDTDIKANEENYNIVCSILEDDLLQKIEDTNDLLQKIKDTKDELKNVLSKVEGFFDISEFENFFENFNFEAIEFEIMNNQNAEKKNMIREYFNNFYEKCRMNIIDKLRNVGIVKDNNLTFEVDLYNKKIMSEIITYCLQVKDNKSLSGIVDYVHIQDSISNDYSFIIDDLEISNLKLFDTYGLDHATWDGRKEKVLSDILYSLQDKKLLRFNSEMAIIYIKKLDAGKPTELKSIISKIYKMVPQASVYCVLNGLDIFLGSQTNSFNGFDYDNELQKKPKSIEYLINEETMKEIMTQNDNNQFIKHLYETLKNNILVFCSDTYVLEKNFNLLQNNKKEVYKLLVSICMKEYSSMVIIPNEIIGNIDNGKYDSKIEKMIKEIFEKASKTNWHKEHYKTTEANYKRLSDNQKDELGYWGTYNHKWNYLFHNGYIEVINSSKSNFLGIEECYEDYKYAVDACIKNMEEKFLGRSYVLAYKDIDDENKGEFRKLVEEMYVLGKGKEKGYDCNPFKDTYSGILDEEAFLNNIYNFEMGYEFIKKELLDHFRKCLMETIKEENRAKSINLLKINYGFYAQLNKLKYDFNKKYKNANFIDILKYYSLNLLT